LSVALCTRLALVIAAPSWLGLEPGRKFSASPPLAFVISNNHGKVNSRYRKKARGRPRTTGLGTGILVRMHDQLEGLDAWIVKQKEPGLTRPEAIRRLVELGLTIRPKRKQAPAARAARAKELASSAIATMTDPSVPAEERAQRRHRLIKGPEEFQELRVDRPKAKSK
jgi:hypothetical protein